MSTVAQYTKYFGLASDPFDSDVAVDSFFSAGMRQNHLDQLIHLSRYSPDVVTITGDSGCGKSTLLNFFLPRLDSDFVVSVVQAVPDMNPHGLLTEFLQQFQLHALDGESEYELIEKLADFSLSVEEDSRLVLLVLDNAHELADDALDTLLKLSTDQTAGNNLRIILFGQPQLNKMLEYSRSLSEAGNALASIELQPFDADETSSYITFRLRDCGYNEELPFNAKQLQKIYRASKGIPGAINVVAREEMISMCEQKKGMRFGLPVPHMTMIIVILTVLIFSYIFKGNLSDDDSLQVTGSDSEAGSQRRIELPLGNLTSSARAIEAEQIAAQRVQSLPPAELPLNGQVEALAQIAEADPDTRQRLNAGDSEIVDVVETAEVVVGLPSGELITNTATGIPDDSTDNSPPGLSDSTQPTNVIPEIPIETDPLPNRDVTLSSALILPAGQVDLVEQAEEVESEPAGLSGISSVSDQELRLLSLGPDQFTLQMLGSYSESNVQEFIRDNGASDAFSYFETRFHDRPWYVVVFGAYPSHSSAVAAISTLTARLKNQQPWVRDLRGIQGDIRKHNQ